MLFGKTPFSKRLRKATSEEEKEFNRMMSEENIPISDKVIMIITAFLVIVLPCALILIGMSALVMWIFGII